MAEEEEGDGVADTGERLTAREPNESDHGGGGGRAVVRERRERGKRGQGGEEEEWMKSKGLDREKDKIGLGRRAQGRNGLGRKEAEEDAFLANETISPALAEARDRWLPHISLVPDWLQHCGLAMQSPELHYRVQDSEGQDMASSLRPGLHLFSSDLVPNAKASLSTKEDMKASCTDFVLHVGGSVWALDWCPQRPQWSNFNVKTEFLVVGAHPVQEPQHRLGEALHGKGLLQIWALDPCVTRGSIHQESNKPPLDVRAEEIGRRCGDDGMREVNLVNAQDITSESSDELEAVSLLGEQVLNSSLEENDLLSSVSTETVGRERVGTEGRGKRGTGRGRGRGRGGGKGREKADRRKIQDDHALQGSGKVDSVRMCSIPEVSTPERAKLRLKNRARTKGVGLHCGLATSPQRFSVPVSSDDDTPKMVLGLVHEGEVTWDAKWRPVTIHTVVEDMEDRELLRLGFLAVLLGDGSIQVFDVPLPKALDWAGIREQNTMELGPPIVKMDPIFWCSELYSAGHQSIPLAVEWSTWAPHDMLVAVCHDGTVAVWKVFPALSPLQETRPLLFFTADSQPLRAVAWVPDGSGSASKHLISTGGHSGYIRFWDLRDPFRPVFEFQISRACITNMDWLAQPRCMLVTMDDGTLRLFGLDNGGSNTPFTGKPYSGTQLQGLQSYFCSSFSLWAAQASRTLGLVAYCAADGTVLQFQLTEKAIVKEGNRYREPHYLCGAFAAESETGTISILSQYQATPAPMRKSTTEFGSTPRSRRGYLATRNQAMRGNGTPVPPLFSSPNETSLPNSDNPTAKKRKAAGAKAKRGKKGEKRDESFALTLLEDDSKEFVQLLPSTSGELELVLGDQASPMEVERDGATPGSVQKPENGISFGVERFPLRVVAVHRVRWNVNKGRERWLAYGGAAGLVRCQQILPK